jgi:hypothetical protein
MITYNCPVCGQSGLADFKSQHISCPQCNSDLKPYQLLSAITKTDKRKNRLSLLLAIFSLVIMFVSILLIKSGIDTKNDLDISNNQIVQLEDSVFRLNNKNLSLANKIIEIENQTAQYKYVKYTVRKGDFPWKIAEFFYGDGRKYVLIEKDNNLIQPYNLQVGQVLLIKMPE